MSYPGPPGVSKGASHPSLPPRPPPSKLPGFKPAFSAAPSAVPANSAAGYPATTTSSAYPSAPAYGVASAPGGYGAPPSASPYNTTATGAAVGGGRGGYNQPNSYSYSQPSYSQQPPSYYGAANDASGDSNVYGAAPQIRNPFPAPNAQVPDFDPEMTAQIAQWQSAYMPKDPSDPTSKVSHTGGRTGAGSSAPVTQPGVSATAEAVDHSAAAVGDEKKKTVYREGGGKKWQDDSLLEWDPAHLRLFVGNLAGETTDESLLKAFSRWKSVQRAKVIRDKRTTKSKGFGFVSFSDPDDFFQAAKEMNGKYIQSHPVVVHKAKTEIKVAAVKDDRKGGRYKNKKGGGNNGKKSGSGAGGAQDAAAYEPHLGPAGGGVTKPGQKTRGGLRIIG
ncbi:hypothetical protein B0T25DRAFT_13540 [Lasiosphaeria hispida]|uniref:RRM domain-containing protein n=1 Tax=Lasiosphaeria hispida TaxID=260671 RepID=A0AAJ0HTQ5_9PEZI|nr:hypothetical protein B0T25DRAFT_13540 [Lasiosphaeria hispida]